MASTLNENELLEEASELCHIEWMDWSKNIGKELYYVLNILNSNIQYLNIGNNLKNDERDKLINDNIELVQNITDRLERWESLWIPYEELSEDMKEADREYARKILKLSERQE